jgi:hypothetical protein
MWPLPGSFACARQDFATQKSDPRHVHRDQRGIGMGSQAVPSTMRALRKLHWQEPSVPIEIADSQTAFAKPAANELLGRAVIVPHVRDRQKSARRHPPLRPS